jgi:hypothetical protein
VSAHTPSSEKENAMPSAKENFAVASAMLVLLGVQLADRARRSLSDRAHARTRRNAPRRAATSSGRG